MFLERWAGVRDLHWYWRAIDLFVKKREACTGQLAAEKVWVAGVQRELIIIVWKQESQQKFIIDAIMRGG